MTNQTVRLRLVRMVKSSAFARLAIGLAWGLSLSWLISHENKAWFRDFPAVFTALLALAGGLPFVLLGGVGRLRAITLMAWAATVAVLAGLYGAYDHWRNPFEDYGAGKALRHSLSWTFVLIGWVWLFIAHHQVEPSDAERTWRPSYRGRFEGASRNLVQLLFSAAFAGVVFGVVKLGGVLFKIIGLSWLEDASDNDWLYPGVLTVSFAAAVHITDVRPAVIRSVRTVALNLLSWTLPLLTALVVAFLCAIPFSRAGGLWHGWLPSVALLWAVVVLIVLINAAYQDGQKDQYPAQVLRWSARLAGLALVPLTGLAAFGLAVRVAHYGLSPERVWAFAAVAICGLYALGYAWAAIDPRTWMARIEPVNVVAAGVMLAAGLLLCSPLLDPARLSVADQMHRLKTGQTRPEKLDVLALRFRDGRFGREALQTLARSSDQRLAKRARLGLASLNRYSEPNEGELLPPFSGATVYPAGARLPDSLRRQKWPQEVSPDCFTSGSKCQVLLADVNGDGVAEVIVQEPHGAPVVFAETAQGWAVSGRYGAAECPPSLSDIAAGTPTASLARDLTAKGTRIPFVPNVQCPRPPNEARRSLEPQSALIEIQ